MQGLENVSVLVTVTIYKSFSRIRHNVQSAQTELLSKVLRFKMLIR